jgi:hypothetical protein
MAVVLAFQPGRTQVECVGVNGVCEKLGKEIQREHAGMQVKSTSRESVLFFFRCFFNPRGGQTLEIPTQ